MKRAYGIVAVLIFVFAVVFTLGNSVAQAQRGGRAARPATTMDSTPQTFDTREYAIRVVPVARHNLISCGSDHYRQCFGK